MTNPYKEALLKVIKHPPIVEFMGMFFCTWCESKSTAKENFVHRRQCEWNEVELTATQREEPNPERIE